MTTNLRFLLSFALASLLAACGGGSLPSDDGNVRLVNATSSFASLDLAATNNVVVSAVTPLSGSPFAALKNGNYAIDVRATGSGTALVTGSLSLAKKDFQTVVAYSTAGTLAMQVLSDKESDPSSGNAKVRVFNAASGDTGALDVYLFNGACSALVASGAAPFAAAISGLQAAYTQVTASATTSYHVCVTTPGDKTEVRLDIPSLVLSDQRIVTIILVSSSGGFLVNGLTLDQQGALAQTASGSARVRVAASLSPATPVSVTVNGTAVAAGLGTPGVSPYQLVTSGTLNVTINGAAYTPATALTVASGADATLLLTGPTPTVTLLADDNTASSSTTRPVKIRLVNGLNGSNGAVALTVNNAPVGTTTAFGTASGYSLVPASAALASLQATSGVLTYYLATGVTLSTGGVYTLFLIGNATSAPSAGVLIQDR
jgi:hypothetical protein